MEFELQILRLIQSCANPFLDALFITLTMLGEKLPMIALFSIVYWTLDKKAGERLAWTMCFSMTLNGAIKGIVKAPRPIGEPGIRSLRVETATGYSFPSGHSQNSAAFYPSLAGALPPRERVLRAVLWLLPLAVGFSRLYLGVHYPRDVLAGLILGYGSVFLTRALFSRVRRRSLLYLAAALLFAPLLAAGDNPDFSAALGCLFGLAAAVQFEKRFVGFTTDIPAARKAIRWLCGVLLLGVFAGILKRALPSGGLPETLRYAALIFAGMGLYPWLFTAVEKRWK